MDFNSSSSSLVESEREREIEEKECHVTLRDLNIDRVRVETKTKNFKDEVDFGVDRFGSRLVSTDDLECTFSHTPHTFIILTHKITHKNLTHY